MRVAEPQYGDLKVITLRYVVPPVDDPSRRGRPIAVLSPIDAEEFYDYVLAHSPEFVTGRKPPRSALPAASTGNHSTT